MADVLKLAEDVTKAKMKYLRGPSCLFLGILRDNMQTLSGHLRRFGSRFRRVKMDIRHLRIAYANAKVSVPFAKISASNTTGRY